MGGRTFWLYFIFAAKAKYPQLGDVDSLAFFHLLEVLARSLMELYGHYFIVHCSGKALIHCTCIFLILGLGTKLPSFIRDVFDAKQIHLYNWESIYHAPL